MRDGNVEVGEVKALSKFGLSRVWGYSGMIAPALPAGGRTRARIFFLERYDPARIPVVFVYGMMGTPTQFSAYPSTHVAVLSDAGVLRDVHALLGQCAVR